MKTMASLLTDAWRMAALYVAVNALVMLVLGMLVVRARFKTSTAGIDSGGHPLMLRVIHAHGNNTENVPLPLLMMLAVAALGGSAWLIHAIGVPLTVGRVLHGIAVSRSADATITRFLGVSLSWIAFVGGIAALIWLIFDAPV